MLTFVLWQRKNRTEDRESAEKAAARLAEIYAPVFGETLSGQTRMSPSASLAFIEKPIRGWSPPSFVDLPEPRSGWVAAPDYPINIRAALERASVSVGAEPLEALAGALEDNPEPVLAELAPPCSLLWSNQAGEVFAQCDGLGQAQFFEYEDDDVWALTNRVIALKAIGARLDPDPVDWATRFAIDWFPLDRTGYKAVRRVGPGTQIRLTRERVTRTTHDVLSQWVHPPERSIDDCLELGHQSLRGIFKESMEYWNCPSVGLSGGWDSRALVSILRDLEADVSLRVRGNPGRYDVMIAAKLAEIAGMKIRIKNMGGYPPDDTQSTRECIRKALIWQGGHLPTLKHKTFVARKGHLNGGLVNVMGQHAGLGKGDFAVKIGAENLAPEEYEDHLVAYLTKKLPPYTRPELREQVEERVREGYRAADRYDMEGVSRLHFFFLHEYTRRWASASLSSQDGLVIAPYLNPDFIRACYAFPLEKIPEKPFHKYVTGKLAPDWADIVYEDQATEEHIESGYLKPVKLNSKRHKVHQDTDWKLWRAHKKYSSSRYWRTVGEPVISEAFANEGFWCDIFDPREARRSWDDAPGKVAPDPLAVAHLLSTVV